MNQRHHDRIGWQAQLMRQRQMERLEQQRKAQEQAALLRLQRFTTLFVMLLLAVAMAVATVWLIRGHL